MRPGVDEFLIGTNYYPVYFSKSDWERDLATIADCGLNSVRTAELLGGWDRIEIAEGEHDFSWLDATMELADRNGLRMVLGTGTPSPPAWLARVHPDVAIVAHDGSRYAPGAFWSWACHNHAGYREIARGWIETLVGRYRDHPALACWQIYNEPAYPFRPEEGGAMRRFDYHPATVARFRGWLRERYGSLDALNEAWMSLATNAAYDSWDTVAPPQVPPMAWGVVAAWADWQEFLAQDFADYVAWEADLVRGLDDRHPTMTNFPSLSYRVDPFGVRTALDPWRLADAVDILGLDLYPGIGDRDRGIPDYVHFALDHARSIARHRGCVLWVPELEGGPIEGWYLGPDHHADATDIGRLTAQVLAGGAKQISYHPWRECPPMPIHWGAPADLEGRPTPIAGEIGRIARVVQAHEELFLAAEPPAADVAVLYSRRTAVHLAGVDQEAFYETALRGAYLSLWEHGLAVEFLTPREVVDGGLDRYRALLLPFAASLDRATGEALASWVAAGGLLVGTAKCPMVDERGWWYAVKPGAGLHEVFGVRQTGIRQRDEIALTVPDGAIDGWSGGTVRGSRHIVDLELAEAATVLGRFADGRPAVVEHPHGDGRAVYVATHVDHARGDGDGDAAAGRLLAGIVRAAGVVPVVDPAPAQQPGVEVRALERADERVVVLTNLADDAATVSLARPALDGITDLLDGCAAVDGRAVVVPARGCRLLHGHLRT